MSKRYHKTTTFNRRFWVLLMVVCAVVVIVCAGILGVHFYKQNKAKQEYQELQQKVKIEEESPVVTQKEEPEIPQEQQDVEAGKTIDFETLWQTNKDIYAWIEIPETSVDYPVAQHAEDDAYYLNHTIEYREGRPGSIYSEKISKTDFSEFIHIMYGHNMKNGTMFADLHKFEDAEFFRENDTIYIYTPEHTYVYRIFAAVVVGDEHIMYSYDFTSASGKQEYLDSLYSNEDSRSRIRSDVEVTVVDQILVLSTCVLNETDKRYLVNAVLTEVR